MEQILGPHRCRAVGIQPFRQAPLCLGSVASPHGEERKPDMEMYEPAVGIPLRQRAEACDHTLRPRRHDRPDGRLNRIGVLAEQRLEPAPSLGSTTALVGALGRAERSGVPVTAEDVELERRRSRPSPPGRGPSVVLLDERCAHGNGRRCESGSACDQAHASARGHGSSVAGKRSGHRYTCESEMSTYRNLLQQIKSEIAEVDASQAREVIATDDVAVVDVRERDEWEEGHIPDAVHIPRGHLESRIEGTVPDHSQTVIVYCASGNRSAFAAKTLEDLGYESVSSLAGGFTDWKRNGLPFEIPQALDESKRRRYSRHLLIPEVGEAGQLRLLESRMLLIGAGGLGSPAALYLAAAGVGTLGIVDDDAVDETNLQRQIVHSTERLGDSKAESAKRTIEALNPDTTVKVFRERLTSDNADRILSEGWDVIVDGADNFPTRYLLNDASVWHGIPVVHGSIFRFEGQTTVFKPGEGPCYRCLFPQPPPPELAPSCAEGGVLGVLPGVIGSLQANEALKLALGIGEPLVGRLLMFDALEATFTEIALRRDPDCPVCGESPTITEYVDYVEFCQGPRAQLASHHPTH
jgi:molybdopterin/thiamine biosynthesis adenylyltransferase/rhodanese-related sulfurtransferase